MATKAKNDFQKRATEKIENNYLFDAVLRGDLEGVKRALTNGANINAVDHNGATPLIVAIENKYEPLAHYLLDQGCDINIQKKLDGQDTALTSAIVEGLQNIALRLIEMGAELNVQDVGKRTPLFIAANNGDYLIVDKLIEKKAKLDIPYYLHETALTCLLRKDLVMEDQDDNKITDHLMIEKLLAAGANPSYVGENRWTGLMNAVANDDLKSVELLLKYGARLDQKDIPGRTALDLAKQYGRTEIIDLLISTQIARDMQGGLKKRMKAPKPIRLKK